MYWLDLYRTCILVFSLFVTRMLLTCISEQFHIIVHHYTYLHVCIGCMFIINTSSSCLKSILNANNKLWYDWKIKFSAKKCHCVYNRSKPGLNHDDIQKNYTVIYEPLLVSSFPHGEAFILNSSLGHAKLVSKET